MEITMEYLKKKRDVAVHEYTEAVKNAPTWKTARYSKLLNRKPSTDADLTNELTSYIQNLNMIAQAYFGKDVWSFEEQVTELKGGAID